ncbi:hypothetical protein EON65_06250 [archaeon]|nr:MAG: hypothetical protein EON65_06250 [archaeon]
MFCQVKFVMVLREFLLDMHIALVLGDAKRQWFGSSAPQLEVSFSPKSFWKVLEFQNSRFVLPLSFHLWPAEYVVS